MHFKSLVPLFLLGGAYAAAIDVQAAQAPQDGTAIANLLKDLNTSFKNLDKLIAGISKENVAGQMTKLIEESGKVNAMLSKNAAKIKSSKPVSGIGDLLPLISVIGPILQTTNKTIRDVIEKRPIVLEAKLDGKLRDGLMTSEPGMVSLFTALAGQISLPAPKAQTNADGTSAPAPPPMPKLTEETIKPIVDQGIDFVIGIFNGTVDLSALAAQAKDAFAKFGGKGKGPKADGTGAPAAPSAASTMTAPAAAGKGAPAAAGKAAGGHSGHTGKLAYLGDYM